MIFKGSTVISVLTSPKRSLFLFRSKKIYFSRKEAQLQMEGSFLVRLTYDDAITYNVVAAAEKVLGKN